MSCSRQKIKSLSPLLLFLLLVLAVAFVFRSRSAESLLPRSLAPDEIIQCQILCLSAGEDGAVLVFTDDPERIAEVLSLLRDTRVRFSGLHLSNGIQYDGDAPYHLSFFDGTGTDTELIVTGDGYILAGRRRYRILPSEQEEFLPSFARWLAEWTKAPGTP